MKRDNIRNIAIIAHVDHGKTTLVDAMLRQTRVSRKIEEMGERIMDSMDLERERGITIKAKNASIQYKDTKINIVDTPGHADFGGEVERTLKMVDGVLLLVDAKEGPMPQTKFVLRKALALGHKAIVVINKIDRPDARVDDVVNKTFDLFVDLGATDEQLNFPIIYASGIAGTATLSMDKPSENLVPLFETILEKIPAPDVDAMGPLQILVLALQYDSYKGKMGIGRIQSGSIKKGDPIVQLKVDGTKVVGKATAILEFEGLEKKEVEEAKAGEIVSVSGLPEINIGETIGDPKNPVALTPVAIDEPTVQMTFGVNTSPFAGKDGTLVTSRHLRERLYHELEVNVSLRVVDTAQADTFLVSGRGELHLGILIETMRREGFELQISEPEVIIKEQNGVKMEPYEFLSVDVPTEYQGAVIEEMGRRKGEMKVMQQSVTGKEVHFEFIAPTRTIIGLGSVLMTKSKGTAVLSHIFAHYDKLAGDVRRNPHGSLIASEDGVSNSYGLNNAQERGILFITSAVPVYAGMVVGQNARDEDLEVNVCRQKKMSNMRSSGADFAVVITPPREITLDYALEYIGSDELVEVTPKSLRLRKRILNPDERKRAAKKSEDNK